MLRQADGTVCIGSCCSALVQLGTCCVGSKLAGCSPRQVAGTAPGACLPQASKKNDSTQSVRAAIPSIHTACGKAQLSGQAICCVGPSTLWVSVNTVMVLICTLCHATSCSEQPVPYVTVQYSAAGHRPLLTCSRWEFGWQTLCGLVTTGGSQPPSKLSRILGASNLCCCVWTCYSVGSGPVCRSVMVWRCHNHVYINCQKQLVATVAEREQGHEQQQQQQSSSMVLKATYCVLLQGTTELSVGTVPYVQPCGQVCAKPSARRA